MDCRRVDLARLPTGRSERPVGTKPSWLSRCDRLASYALAASADREGRDAWRYGGGRQRGAPPAPKPPKICRKEGHRFGGGPSSRHPGNHPPPPPPTPA